MEAVPCLNFCGNCGSKLPVGRVVTSATQLIEKRCVDRWVDLQLSVVATKKKTESLVRKFLLFLGKFTEQPSMFTATPFDVVMFFMEKRGRTLVHKRGCSEFGTVYSPGVSTCKCALRLAASTLNGQIGQLQGAFRDVGLHGPYCHRTHAGNPCNSSEVKMYDKLNGKEQLQAGVKVKQADLISFSVFTALTDILCKRWARATRLEKHDEAAGWARDALFYSIMWCTGLRAADCFQLLSQSVKMCSLESGDFKRGWKLAVLGSKTEFRVGQNRLFVIGDDGSRYVPMRPYTMYLASLSRLGMKLENGALFSEIVSADDGSWRWGQVTNYKIMEPRFKELVSVLGLPMTVKLHSFHGSHALERESEGVPREEVCREMAWTESTRARYVDGREVITFGQKERKVVLDKVVTGVVRKSRDGGKR